MVRLFGHNSKDSRNIGIKMEAYPVLKKIGSYLKNVKTDANFTSPYPRCADSAKIVGEVAKKKFVKNDMLRELEKNGEGFNKFGLRVRTFLNMIHDKKYSSVAICTHGAVIGALKHLIVSGEYSFYNVWDYPQPGNLIIIKNKKIEVMDFNRK